MPPRQRGIDTKAEEFRAKAELMGDEDIFAQHFRLAEAYEAMAENEERVITPNREKDGSAGKSGAWLSDGLRREPGFRTSRFFLDPLLRPLGTAEMAFLVRVLSPSPPPYCTSRPTLRGQG